MVGILFRLRYKYIYDFLLCQEANEKYNTLWYNMYPLPPSIYGEQNVYFYRSPSKDRGNGYMLYYKFTRLNDPMTINTAPSRSESRAISHQRHNG